MGRKKPATLLGRYLSARLYAYNPTTGENQQWDVGQHVDTVVLRASGGVMLVLLDGFASFDLTSGELTMLADPEADQAGNRFNDGKCDPGRALLGRDNGV